MPDFPAHTLKFSTTNPELAVRVLRGEGPPTIQGGYGGWEEQARPRKVSITKWVGRSPLKLILPIVLDDLEDRGDVEHECQVLELMAFPVPPSGEPPVVHIEGAVPHREADWVITDIEWGDAIYAKSMEIKRIRQFASVNFISRVKADRIKANKNAKDKGGKSGYRIYIVKRGDTLRKIAAKQLHDSARWKEIAKINKIRDPKSIYPGQRLKIPRQ